MSFMEKLDSASIEGCSTDLEAAARIMSGPRFSIVDEGWIPDCAEIIKNSHPDQARYVRNLADISVDGTFEGYEQLSESEKRIRYDHPHGTMTRRGRMAGILARCWALFGEASYRDTCIESILQLADDHSVLPAEDPAPAADWHPGALKRPAGFETGHVGENITLLLPFIRTSLTDEQSLKLLDFLWKVGDYTYRVSHTDVVNNLPFHMLVPSLLIGLAVPEFKASETWVTEGIKRVQHLYAGPRHCADGYFREGFSYQRVNQNLLMRCYLGIKRSGRPVPAEIETAALKSMEFAAAIIRNDGHPPAVGDGGNSGFWEHDIGLHEFLHLGAAVFNRPDLRQCAGTPQHPDPDIYLLWLMGREGYEAWQAMPAPDYSSRPQACHDLHKSGFQVLGAGCGTEAHYGLLNYSTNHNHAHYDALGLDIMGLGRPLILDPGTASYHSIDRSEECHSLCCMLRLTRLGPRVEGYNSTGTLYVGYDNSHIKSSGAFHDLYEGHRVTRTTTLCLPGGDGDQGDVPAFWIVTDSLSRSSALLPGEDECPIDELTETLFGFNAPGTQLGMDTDSLTGWSAHQPGAETVEVVAGLAFPAGERSNKAKAEVDRVLDLADSDANIQVTGFSEADRLFDMREHSFFVNSYGGRAPSAGVGFRWRGALPHRAVYILVPFRGIIDKPLCRVEGSLEGDNFKGTVHLPSGPVEVAFNGVEGIEGSISMKSTDADETIAFAPEASYASRI